MNKHHMKLEEFNHMIYMACHVKGRDEMGYAIYCTPAHVILSCTSCGKRMYWGEGKIEILYKMYTDGCRSCAGRLELVLSDTKLDPFEF